jgi:hypothetical protein
VPVKWCSNRAARQFVEPLKCLFDLVCIEVVPVASASDDVELAKVQGDWRAVASEIDEVITDQDLFGDSGITSEVERLERSICPAMPGVLLNPTSCRIAMVDVVPESNSIAAMQIRTFPSESKVVPILIEREGLCDPHGIHEEPGSSIFRCACPHDPVANAGDASNLRLARCKGAETVEGVRCEPDVVIDDITMKFH